MEGSEIGENPDNDNFITDIVCEDCDVAMFPDGTPRWILLSVSGITACPPFAGELPNGSFLLEQHATDGCRWELDDGTFIFDVSVGDFWGCIISESADVNDFFVDSVGGPCTDLFTNDFDDCDEGGISINGIAIMSWGPSIHP